MLTARPNADRSIHAGDRAVFVATLLIGFMLLGSSLMV